MLVYSIYDNPNITRMVLHMSEKEHKRREPRARYNQQERLEENEIVVLRSLRLQITLKSIGY